MPRKTTGWQVFSAGPCKYGVQVDGIPLFYINDKMIAKAKSETQAMRDAVLRNLAVSLSAHQEMRNALFVTLLSLTRNKVSAKKFRNEIKMLRDAMEKAEGLS